MGFDKVKINTTPLLLLLLEGVVDMALSQTTLHTHTHTPSDRYHTSRRSHSHPDIYVVGSPPHPFLALPLLQHRYPYLGVCVLGINIPTSLLLPSFSSSPATLFASMDFHDNSFRKGPFFSPSPSLSPSLSPGEILMDFLWIAMKNSFKFQNEKA